MAQPPRQEKENILKHLIDVVLSIDSDVNHPLRISFHENCVQTIDDFDHWGIDDINALTYTYVNKIDPTKSTTKLLPPGHRGNLRHLLKYVKLIVAKYESEHGSYPRLDHWKTFTWEKFQIYKAYTATNDIATDNTPPESLVLMFNLRLLVLPLIVTLLHL